MDAALYIGIFLICIGSLYTFYRITQKPEYDLLRKHSFSKAHKLAVLTLAFWRRQDFTYKRAHARLITIGILYALGILFLIWFYATLLALLELYVDGH
ncbi:hypothetical protein [Pseudovibrio ascidiaceicola]|uniref:hypothetical protein n=1 Tax=Pseudovibrio ascidiaceicola TaxID=285279 RepID=UPI000D69F219|nr:hypothetical protein [Pseudovibrio ascidiaceicola]